jgi:uncharacterized protein (TIGR03435 family)
MAYAYELPFDRVNGPDWIAGPGAPRFDVHADFPDGARDYQIPEMLRSLLAERFHLAVHRETRRESVDCLTVTAGGLRLPPAEESGVSISIGRALAQAGGNGETAFLNGIIIWTTHSPYGVTVLALGEHAEHTASFTNWRAGTASSTSDYRALPDDRLHVRLQASSTTTKGIADLLVWLAVSPEVEDMTQTGGRFKLDISLRLSKTAGPEPLAGRGTGAGNAFHEARLKDYNKALAPFGLHVGPRTAPVEVVIVDSVDRAPADK